MITSDEVKTQLVIDAADTLHDAWISAAIPAAEMAIANQINRTFYADQDAIDADAESPENALVFSDDLKIATLMLIAHWFEHRETASELTIKQVPYTVDYLVNRYRFIEV